MLPRLGLTFCLYCPEARISVDDFSLAVDFAQVFEGGRSALLLVHCESRYTCVRFDMSGLDWARLGEIAMEEIRCGLLDAGIPEAQVEAYLAEAGDVEMTRTHGRREVAFLNRAWEDVLAADLLVEEDSHRQPLLNRMVNSRPCRCAGEEGLAAAQTHLEHYFARK